jgi:hypothetical protein
MFNYNIIQLGNTKANRDNGIAGGEYLFGSAGDRVRKYTGSLYYLVHHEGEAMHYHVRREFRTNFKMIIESEKEIESLDYTE